MCQAKKELKIYKVMQEIIQGTCLSRLRGFKDVFIGFKLAIINTYTHTWPLGHLSVTISVKKKHMHLKSMCKRRYKRRFKWPWESLGGQMGYIFIYVIPLLKAKFYLFLLIKGTVSKKTFYSNKGVYQGYIKTKQKKTRPLRNIF